MKHRIRGRMLAHPWALACTVSFPFLLSLLYGCREQIPSAPAPPTITLQFALPLNSYYSYDNWKLSPEGSRILESRFRTSWRVVEINAIAMGYSGVTDVIDSTFAGSVSGTDSLVQVGHRYFRTAANGDVFEYGFIARFLQLRDTLQVSPQWDKLLSPSTGFNVLWTVETSDPPSVGVVEGRFLPQLETVEDSINGAAIGVLAYHVEITSVDLTLGIWVGGSPPAFLREWDQSDVPFNRIFQELRVRRTE